MKFHSSSVATWVVILSSMLEMFSMDEAWITSQCLSSNLV